MPWQYHQKTGQLFYDGQLVDTGYSGRGAGKNNPQLEATANVGPIPSGAYKIGPAFTDGAKGPVVMRLTPVGHTAHGREGFLIHGDSRSHPGEASEGCIILDRTIRERIAASHDTALEVVT
jgi:hypothetical protein